MGLIDTGVKVLKQQCPVLPVIAEKNLLDLPVTRLKTTALHEPKMHID